MKNSAGKIGQKIASKKVEELESEVKHLCATKNAEVAGDHLKNIETLEGHFC
jgi:hypothetical protein